MLWLESLFCREYRHMPSLYVNCKFWKYKIENRKIKYFLSTHTENIEIVDIDEN